MAIALGFGQGNKDTPMAGSTGGGQVQPLQLKMGQDGQLGLATDGSGGFLNYLKGLAQPSAGATVAAGTPAASSAIKTMGAMGGAAAPAAGAGAAGSAGLLSGGV